MKRRAFLQRAGWLLAALGLTETGLWQLGDRYQRVLAASTSRKLALLIGINRYPCQGSLCEPLQGCLTDVALQRELLVHRFGFQPEDVLVLTDQQATWQGITDAFLNHLTAQAKAGDVVVFHFSGYSRQVSLIGDDGATVQHSLVPVDALDAPVESLSDLLAETLLLLLRSLPTDQITTILDTSYTLHRKPEPAKPSGEDSVEMFRVSTFLRRRDRLDAIGGKLGYAELALQEQLRTQLHLTKAQVSLARSTGQIPGILLTATSNSSMPRVGNSPAFEARWSGFSAGLFTYALTQHLWSATPATSVQVSLSRAIGTVEQVVGDAQHPDLGGQKSQAPLPLAKHLPPDSMPGNGVITEVDADGKTGRLWLAGLPPTVLECYGINSLFTLSPSTANAPTKRVQVYGRDGLTARVRLVEPVSSTTPSTEQLDTPPVLIPGQRVQEAVRLLPRDVGLTIALDPNLERIERVDATSALGTIPYVKVATGDQSADYLFGKVSVPNRYGLLTIGQELLPGTVGEGGEAIKQAVHRVTPYLQRLLAAKLLRLTANEASSTLPVRIALELAQPDENVVVYRETPTVRTLGLPPLSPTGTTPSATLVGIPTIPVGSRIRYRIQNAGDRTLYLMIMGTDSNGSITALYTGSSSTIPDVKPSLQPIVLSPSETLVVPQPSSSAEWIVREPAGLAEFHLFLSVRPFAQTLATLETSTRMIGSGQRISPLENPVEVARAVLQDLQAASLSLEAALNPASDTFALNVNAWATLSVVYQVG